jgi:hypothetical protein
VYRVRGEVFLFFFVRGFKEIEITGPYACSLACDMLCVFKYSHTLVTFLNIACVLLDTAVRIGLELCSL